MPRKYVPTGKPRGRPKGWRKPLPAGPVAAKMEGLTLHEKRDLAVKWGKLGGRPPSRDPINKVFEFNTEHTDLPHLHGFKLYKWQRDFLESTNKMNLLTACNQGGKSTVQVQKCIHWATEKELWPKLWRTKPEAFFYLYPDYPMFQVEYNSKWKPLLLPRGKMKEDKKYGWSEVVDRGKVIGIKFNSGVHVWFRTYSQKVSALQGSTLHAVFCFTPDTLVICESGLKPIGDIEVGERVLSHDGKLHPVLKVYRHKAKVRQGHFSTDNHPFATQDGWKSYGELTSKDTCIIYPAWRILQKLYDLRVWITSEDPKVKMQGSETILGALKGLGIGIFMWLSGRVTIKNVFHGVMLCIISILTRWIIGSKICSALVERNTPEYIKRPSGSSQSIEERLVADVEKPSEQELHRKPPQIFVPPSAARCAKFYAFVEGVLKNLSLLLRTVNPIDFALKRADPSPGSLKQKIKWLSYPVSFVARLLKNLSLQKLDIAPTPAENSDLQDVINLEVKDTNTYFASKALVHNCDEEMNENLYPEVSARLNATEGYFHMVFTATKGQEIWRQAMTPARGDKEYFPHAFKQTVSLYDCMYFEDGTPGVYDEARIEEIKRNCGSQIEIDRRVYGKFVNEEGLRFPSFSLERHYVKPFPITKDYSIYAGVDIGSGGSNHPAAITFLAVNPEHTKGYIFKGWRGDRVGDTTASDVMDKFLQLKASHNIVRQVYDYSSREFGIIAQRIGEPFQRAEKSRDLGTQTINTLFANDMLFIFEDDPELHKLGTEFMNLKHGAKKTASNTRDDFVDSAVYTVTQVSWDWTCIVAPEYKAEPMALAPAEKTKEQRAQEQIQRRREAFLPPKPSDDSDLAEEVAYWNDLAGT